MRKFKFFQNLKKFSFLDTPVEYIEPVPEVGNYHRIMKETVFTDHMMILLNSEDNFMDHIKRVHTSEITNKLIEEGYFKFETYVDSNGETRFRCSIKVVP